MSGDEFTSNVFYNIKYNVCFSTTRSLFRVCSTCSHPENMARSHHGNKGSKALTDLKQFVLYFHPNPVSCPNANLYEKSFFISWLKVFVIYADNFKCFCDVVKNNHKNTFQILLLANKPVGVCGF